jgi:hypothetical protein
MRFKTFAASSALTLAVVGCAGSSAPDGSDSTETEPVAPAMTTTQALAVVDFESPFAAIFDLCMYGQKESSR